MAGLPIYLYVDYRTYKWKVIIKYHNDHVSIGYARMNMVSNTVHTQNSLQIDYG